MNNLQAEEGKGRGAHTHVVHMGVSDGTELSRMSASNSEQAPEKELRQVDYESESPMEEAKVALAI